MVYVDFFLHDLALVDEYRLKKIINFFEYPKMKHLLLSVAY